MEVLPTNTVQTPSSLVPTHTHVLSPNTIVREHVFYIFFQNPKKRDFLRFFEVSRQKT